jgi:hypothetical protein
MCMVEDFPVSVNPDSLRGNALNKLNRIMNEFGYLNFVIMVLVQ